MPWTHTHVHTALPQFDNAVSSKDQLLACDACILLQLQLQKFAACFQWVYIVSVKSIFKSEQ